MTPKPGLGEHSGGRIAADPTGARSAALRRAAGAAWMLCGLAIAGSMAAVVFAARRAGEAESAGDGRWLERLLYAAAGVFYLAAAILSPRRGAAGRTVAVMLIVAAGLRALMWIAPPVSGADYHRYFWDGAVAANGRNPYKYSPRRVIEGRVDDPGLCDLAERGRPVLQQISHPRLRTIYPPLAHGLFAIAYWLSPFDVTGWWLVLLAFDALAGVLVLEIVRSSGRPIGFAAVYFWNPLLVVETYWGGHMDLAVGAMVLLFTWLLTSRRVVAAAAALAGAIGLKLWPALLVPFRIRASWGRRRRLAAALGVLAGCLALMAIPFAGAFGAGSGLAAYSLNWRSTEGAYRLLAELGLRLKADWNLAPSGNLIGRGLMVTILLAVAAWQGLRKATRADVLCRRAAVLVLLMLLLSPTVWPWYYVAVIPLAAISPAPALLAWTLLLPLAYLPDGLLSDPLLAGIIHSPVWLLLVLSLAGRLLKPARAEQVRVNV